jgi:hypothetical protein
MNTEQRQQLAEQWATAYMAYEEAEEEASRADQFRVEKRTILDRARDMLEQAACVGSNIPTRVFLLDWKVGQKGDTLVKVTWRAGSAWIELLKTEPRE